MPLVGTVLLPRSGDAFLTHGADEEGLKLNPLLFYPMARLPPRASLLTDLAIIATRDAGETSAP